MRPTSENRLVLRELGGIRQVGDEPKELIKEIHGLYDNPARSLQRIPGKTLATTGTGLGPIWSIHHLRFRDGSAVINQQGVNLVSVSESAAIQGMRIPLPAWIWNEEEEEWEIESDNPHTPPPTLPPPYEPDWPSSSPNPRVESSLPTGDELPSYSCRNYLLVVSPLSLAFGYISTAQTAQLMKDTNPRVPDLDCCVLIEWEAEWISHLREVGDTTRIRQGKKSVGKWDISAPFDFTVHIDRTGYAPGAYSGTITFTAVYCTRRAVYVLDCSGRRISTSLPITMLVPDTPPPPVTGWTYTVVQELSWTFCEGDAGPGGSKLLQIGELSGEESAVWALELILDAALVLKVVFAATGGSVDGGTLGPGEFIPRYVNCNPSGLTAGNYTGSLSPNGEPVTVKILKLSLSGDFSWVFSAGDGDTNPVGHTITITNEGDETIDWVRTLSLDAALSGKVTTNKSSGTVVGSGTDTLILTVDPAGIAQGTHGGILTVSSVDDICSVSENISVVVTPEYLGSIKGIGEQTDVPYYLEFTLSYVGHHGSGYHYWRYTYPNTSYWEIRHIDADGRWVTGFHHHVGGSQGADTDVDVTYRPADGYPSGVGAWTGGSPVHDWVLTFGPDVW